MKTYNKANLSELDPFELHGIISLTKAAIKHWVNKNNERGSECAACVSVLIGEFDLALTGQVLNDLQTAWRELAAKECDKRGIDFDAVMNRKLSDFQK